MTAYPASTKLPLYAKKLTVMYDLKDITVLTVDPDGEYEIPNNSKVVIVFPEGDVYVDVEPITDISTQGFLLLRMQYHEIPSSNIEKLYFFTDNPPVTLRLMVTG